MRWGSNQVEPAISVAGENRAALDLGGLRLLMDRDELEALAKLLTDTAKRLRPPGYSPYGLVERPKPKPPGMA